MQFLDEMARMLPPGRKPRLGRHAVYAAFDVEQGVDAGDSLQRDRRALVSRLALSHIAGNVCELEELAPCMAPAQGAEHRRGTAVGMIEVVVAAVGVGLQRALPSNEMPVGVDLLAIGGEVEERCGRSTAREGAVVADVGPEPGLPRCAPSQKRHGGIIATQPFGGQNMGADQIMNRLEGGRASTDLIGQRGEAEIDAFLA